MPASTFLVNILILKTYIRELFCVGTHVLDRTLDSFRMFFIYSATKEVITSRKQPDPKRIRFASDAPEVRHNDMFPSPQGTLLYAWCCAGMCWPCTPLCVSTWGPVSVRLASLPMPVRGPLDGPTQTSLSSPTGSP